MSIISLNTVRDTVGASKTVEDRKLQAHYISAERTLRRILGDTLFERIVDAAETPASDTDADALIEDYITGFLAWFTYKRALPGLYAEPTRNGMQYKNDPNTVQADGSHLNKLMGVAEDSCDQYQNDLIAYLNKDIGKATPLFPEYYDDTDSANDDERVRARKTYAGIVVPKNRRKRPRTMQYDENGYPCE